MATQLIPGPNIVTASIDATWAELGFTSFTVYEVATIVNGNPYSWQPGSSINTLQDVGINKGQTYVVTANSAMNKSPFFDDVNQISDLIQDVDNYTDIDQAGEQRFINIVSDDGPGGTGDSSLAFWNGSELLSIVTVKR